MPRGSVHRPQQRGDVGDRPEVSQLVGVDDPADAPDLTTGDVERTHADQPLLGVEKERSGIAVDLDGTQRDTGYEHDPADPVDDGASDPGAAAQRAGERGSLSAPVAGELDVVGEQSLEPGQIALLGGGEEPARQFIALLASGLEAGPA